MWMHPEKYLVYSEVRNLTYTTHSPEETEKLGEAIAQRLSGERCWRCLAAWAWEKPP